MKGSTGGYVDNLDQHQANSVALELANCGGGKAGCAEDGRLPGSSGRAATLPDSHKAVGFRGTGVAFVLPIGS